VGEHGGRHGEEGAHEPVQPVRDEVGVQGREAAKASACGTTRGITGTVSLPLERICGREMGMRGICAQLAARTMWWAGTRKTESVVGCLEDGQDCTARMCVGGAAPRAEAMSKEDGTLERGSCGGTTAAATEAMSLRR
jgi:ribosomal protein S14